MFAISFTSDNNCFRLVVDRKLTNATIAWLRDQKVGFVLSCGKQTSTFTMRYLRTRVRDRLNRKFNSGARNAILFATSTQRVAAAATTTTTASLVEPSFTRTSRGTYVLVVPVATGVDTHRWLDKLGCKCDRIVGRDLTTRSLSCDYGGGYYSALWAGAVEG